MRAKFVLLVAAVICIVLAVRQPKLTADAPTPSTSPKAPANLTGTEDWNGKVIYVYSEKVGLAFENAQIRQIGGRTFIRGKAVDDGDKSMSGNRINWLPIDNVATIIEFSSPKEYLKAAEEWRAALPAAMPAAPVPAIPVPAIPVPAIPGQVPQK
jgi:hypothetical protein